MNYIVTVYHNGSEWPLRGTVWAYSMDRAQKFETAEEARKALENAKPFMSAKIYKQAKIKAIS